MPSARAAETAATAGSATTAGDAQLLDHLDSADFLRTNGTATNAARLDGFKSADFLQADATAANAALLNGLDSAAFLSSTITVRKSPIGEVANNAISGELAQCNLGERAISGGSTWTTTPGANTMVTLESAPVSGLTGWTVTMGNTSGSLQKFQVVAICVGS